MVRKPDPTKGDASVPSPLHTTPAPTRGWRQFLMILFFVVVLDLNLLTVLMLLRAKRWIYLSKMYFRVIVHSGHSAGISFRSGILGMPFTRRLMGMLQFNPVSLVVFITRSLFYL